MSHMRSFPRLSRLHAIVLLAAVVASFGLGMLWQGTRSGDRGVSICAETLIDPVVCSGDTSDSAKLSYEAFRQDLEDDLAAAKQRGEVTRAGVFFRDLRNGPVLALNDDDGFWPMSLMKMPLMVVILRHAQDNPEVLQQRIKTPPEFAMNVQLMDPKQTLLPDTEYTIDELVRYMIAYSDNRALGMLADWVDTNLGRDAIADTLVKLGLMREQGELPDTVVSPRTYGSILRILYSAAYLNPEYSQKALDYLTQSVFKDGITHDIPGSVRVAHKFGVNDSGNTNVQLHDCGIVYHPEGPYILCVMTEGTSFAKQASYVQGVAARVYEHVTASRQ